jgi:hypothetical protein
VRSLGSSSTTATGWLRAEVSTEFRVLVLCVQYDRFRG